MRIRPLLATLAIIAFAVVSTASHGAADPKKVIRDVFPVAETGFDPAAIHDLYSAGIVRAIFETLYTYDYLARPAKIVPQAADGMPQVTDDGKIYTVKLKNGIYFQPDPAFGGKKRELTADDVVYSYKRVMDPRLRSPYAFLLEGKFVGLDESRTPPRNPASSTTTRRFPASRPSTATPSASA